MSLHKKGLIIEDKIALRESQVTEYKFLSGEPNVPQFTKILSLFNTIVVLKFLKVIFTWCAVTSLSQQSLAILFQKNVLPLC